MEGTRSSLLVRVKDRSDTRSWKEFYDLYAPLLYHYARGRGLSGDDSREVRDRSMAVVFERIGKFQYDRERGRFKGWLRRIVDSRIADMFRKKRARRLESATLRSLADPSPSPEELWERKWKHRHLRYCVREVRDLVSVSSYEVFNLVVFEDRPVEEVCKRLGINRNQVYKAKARVLRRVREKLEALGLEPI